MFIFCLLFALSKLIKLFCANARFVISHNFDQTMATESDACKRLRWVAEIEFVQMLANPWYINYLAQNDFLKRKEFINYLNYLQYWKRPEYAQFLRYPQCLHFLDLLQNEDFRNNIANQQVARFVDDQLLLHWHNYARRRQRLLDNEAAKFQKTTDSTGTTKPV